MYQNLLQQLKGEFDKILGHLKLELMTLRTGRATPALVEDVQVECYGTRMPLKQLAAIYAPEPRLIIVQPWDKSVMKEIERAIVSFRSGLSPIIEGDLIRINIPALTEERRKELVKLLQKILEGARISLRQHRDEIWKQIQVLEKDGRIREDDKFKAKEDLQKLVDKYNQAIEDLGLTKEKEIMTV